MGLTSGPICVILYGQLGKTISLPRAPWTILVAIQNTFSHIMEMAVAVMMNSFFGKDAMSMFMSNIGRKPFLTREGEAFLVTRAHEGDMDARNEIIESNLRLVMSIVKKYKSCGIEFIDLAQEGVIGLTKAIERFDITKGYRFSTYATWWVSQGITRSITNDCRTIRYPAHIVDGKLKIIRAQKALSRILNRQATESDVAEFYEIPLRKVQIFFSLASTTSLDAPMSKSGDNDETWAARAEDKNSVSPESFIENTQQSIAAKRILRTLRPSYELVLRMRYGIGENEE